jgi:hypothetical protein
MLGLSVPEAANRSEEDELKATICHLHRSVTPFLGKAVQFCDAAFLYRSRRSRTF